MVNIKMKDSTYSTLVGSFYTTEYVIPNNIQQECNHEWGEVVPTILQGEKWDVLNSTAGLYPSPTGEFEDVLCDVQTCLKCGEKRVINNESIINRSKTLKPKHTRKRG